MTSNWLWGGGGTVPASILDEVVVVVEDNAPLDAVPSVVALPTVPRLLLVDEALALLPLAEQLVLAVPVAAWF